MAWVNCCNSNLSPPQHFFFSLDQENFIFQPKEPKSWMHCQPVQYFFSWLDFKDIWPAMLFFANFFLVLLGVGLWKNLNFFSFLDFIQQGLLTGAQWSCLTVGFHFHLLSVPVPFCLYHIGLQRNPFFLLPRLQTARTFDRCSMIMFSVPVSFHGDHIGLRRSPPFFSFLDQQGLLTDAQ